MPTYFFKIENLRPLHASLRTLQIYVTVFNFAYNNVTCRCIFQTASAPFELSFVSCPDAKVLSIPIEKGYVAAMSPDLQDKFKEFFNVGGKGGFFDFREFFPHFNGFVPVEATKASAAEDLAAIANARNVEEADKIYFKDLISWDSWNANRRDPVNTPERHRDPRNLEKTKLLLPDLYALIKNKDISVAYTDIPGNLAPVHVD